MSFAAATQWPKGPTTWVKRGVLHISIPFTWNLPKVRERILSGRERFYNRVVVGGPAVKLMPHFFNSLGYVTAGDSYPGVLQRVNPYATKTTVGCPNHCGFCGVPVIEGEFRELDSWPNKPIICDNNLLAASMAHFERVIRRLRRIGWADFNQGLDARLLTRDHARMLATIESPIVRLALDSSRTMPAWSQAFALLRSSGISARSIRTYVLCGFNDDPSDAWSRCEFVSRHKTHPNPQWFHRLGALEHNVVTNDQKRFGWTEKKRTRLFGWYYRRRGTPRKIVA